MTSMDTVREVVSRQFKNVRYVDELVIRGEKIHSNKCYAIAYVDLADDIVGRAEHLREFQERVLGEEFFESPEQLRWNNYLYLVAGPKSVASKGYQDAKSRIEGDKDYARKRVLSEDELVQLLEDSKLFDAENAAPSEDIVSVWAAKLRNAGLDHLLDKPTPRTEVVERIGQGHAVSPIARKNAKRLNALDQALSLAHLNSLEITRFRPVHDGKEYNFGAVTLIVGPNGSGKTSLLEAIEYLYCGNNRRPTLAGPLMVKGTGARRGDAKTFEIASVTDAATIKARSLAWYRRTDHFAREIVDGFTRYNFLDTDAAFRLSTKLEPGDISKDLSRLLIGAEASMLWEYLGKICSDLDVAWKRTSERLVDETERASLLETNVLQIMATPSQAKSLSKTYRAALGAISWRGATFGTDEIVVAKERRELEVLAGCLSEMLAFPMPGTETKGKIRARIGELERAMTVAQPAETRRIKAQEQIKASLKQAAEIDTDVRLLDSWLPYCAAEFSKALLVRQSALEAAESARMRLGRFLGVDLPVIDEELACESIANAEALARRVASSSTVSIASLEAAEKSFGLLEAAHARASQQLKDAAKALLQQGHAVRACPACGADHDPDDLLAKIDGITSRISSPEPLKQLQENLITARAEFAMAQQRLTVLSTIRQIATQLNVNPAQPIGDIVECLQGAWLESQRADAELALAQAHLKNLESNELSEHIFNKVRSETKLLFTSEVNGDRLEVVTALREKRSIARKDLEDEILDLRAEQEAAAEDVRAAIRALDYLGWPLDATTQDLNYRALSDMLAQIKAINALATKVAEFIEIADDKKFADVRAVLAGTIEAFDRALHAVLTETGTSESVKTKQKALDQSKACVRGLGETIKNQRSALDVLEGLIRDNSLESATQDALDSIRLQINDVFGRIHAPSEYEYTGSSERLLQARNGMSSHTLEEVSTGQRAAFALSIFLAMNLTAQSAPPVLLIDDPIAHIDDLNALSFLDYLRDLAVNSRRQIFFATADSRIAALFEKKFAFLGTAAFQKIELARTITG